MAPGPGGTAGQPSGHDTNPEGYPYPTQHVGRQARGLDAAGKPNAQPGNVIANYKFLGYPNADTTQPLQTVALADFFDPMGVKYKVIHVIAAADWCPDCVNETDALVKALSNAATDYRAKGVVYLQAMTEGATPNYGATPQDLTSWISAHHPVFTEVLDPEAHELGAFFDAAAVPFNADIDARTMELLQAGTGYEDPNAIETWIDWVDSNPPSYP